MISGASGCLGNSGLLTILNLSSQFNILDTDGPLGQDSTRCHGVYKKVQSWLWLHCAENALCSRHFPSAVSFISTMLLTVGCSILADRGGNGNLIRQVHAHEHRASKARFHLWLF